MASDPYVIGDQFGNVFIRKERLIHQVGQSWHFANEFKGWCPHCRRLTPEGKAEAALLETIRKVLPPQAGEPTIQKYLRKGVIRYGVPGVSATMQYFLRHRPTKPVRFLVARAGKAKLFEICVVRQDTAQPIADLLVTLLIGLAHNGRIPTEITKQNMTFIKKEIPYGDQNRARVRQERA